MHHVLEEKHDTLRYIQARLCGSCWKNSTEGAREIPIVITWTAGSSGNGTKKNPIALPSVHVGKYHGDQEDKDGKLPWITNEILLVIRHIYPCSNLQDTIQILASVEYLLVAKEQLNGNPNSGYSSTGAIKAGRAARSDGHRSCSEAMAASGSGTRPQTGGARHDDRPKLFVRDDDTYVKMTGEIMKSLIQDEQNGSITLPAKFGDVSTSVTLAESWIPFGRKLDTFWCSIRLCGRINPGRSSHR